MTSRKCPDSDDRAAQRRSVSRLRGPTDEGREERQQREGQHDDEGADPVDPRQRHHGEHRHHDTGDERGEEARGIRLDGRRTLGGERDRPVGVGSALGRCGQPPRRAAARAGPPSPRPRPRRRPARRPTPGPRGPRTAPRATSRASAAACPRRPPRRGPPARTARPIVATPWSTPTTARTATGRRAAGAVLSSRGSKGLIGDADRSPDRDGLGDVLGAEPLAERPVRPGRVEQHDRA